MTTATSIEKTNPKGAVEQIAVPRRRRGNAVAPPPPALQWPAGVKLVFRPATPPEWMCPDCAAWNDYTYGPATDPDARCSVDGCGKPVAPDERRVLSLRQLVEKIDAQSHRVHAATDSTAAVTGDKLACTVNEAGKILNCRETKVYALLKSGKLKPAAKLGKKRMVLTASVNALLIGSTGRTARPPTREKKKTENTGDELAAAILRLTVK